MEKEDEEEKSEDTDEEELDEDEVREELENLIDETPQPIQQIQQAAPSLEFQPIPQEPVENLETDLQETQTTQTTPTQDLQYANASDYETIQETDSTYPEVIHSRAPSLDFNPIQNLDRPRSQQPSAWGQQTQQDSMNTIRTEFDKKKDYESSFEHKRRRD